MSTRLALVLLGGLLASCASAPPENKTETRNVYLLGRFSYPMQRPDLIRNLERLGYTVSGSMTPAVNLVILGTDIVSESGDGFVPVADLPEYGEAVNRGVEMVALAKVRERFPALEGPWTR